MLKSLFSFFLLIIFFSCNSDSPNNIIPDMKGQIDIICPSKVRNSDIIPIVARVKENNQICKLFSETLPLSSNRAILEPSEIKIKKGIGSVSCKITCDRDFTLSIDHPGYKGIKKISVQNCAKYRELSGTLAENDLQWDDSSEIRIVEDLLLPSNQILIVGKGTHIKLGAKVNFDIGGNIICSGTKDKPVLITSINSDQPWGQFNHLSSTGKYKYTIFTNGGIDHSRVFGHSNSEPVIFGDHANISLTNCFIFDNPGKATGAYKCDVTIDSCLISRCDTGGELAKSIATINDSYFIDMPSDDGIFVDDDNDALYMASTFADSIYSTINNCVFIVGKDDAIDHNGANLIISGCWIEGYMHEGLASSNSNTAKIYNTLVKNCQQGVEAGYGSPQVIVDHCVLIKNEVGVRFGDSYDWGCSGHISVTNTIIFDNIEDVKNFDLKTNSSVDGAISISYSLINDEPWGQKTGCITGTPLFDPNYYLLPNSPGIGMANDGLDMGLVK